MTDKPKPPRRSEEELIALHSAFGPVPPKRPVPTKAEAKPQPPAKPKPPKD